jgi:hypothetical protein
MVYLYCACFGGSRSDEAAKTCTSKNYYIRRLTDEYKGYIHQLGDEYMEHVSAGGIYSSVSCHR